MRYVDLYWRDWSSFQLAGTVSGQAAFDKPVRPAALCEHEGAGNRILEKAEGTEMDGVREREETEN